MKKRFIILFLVKYPIQEKTMGIPRNTTTGILKKCFIYDMSF